MSLSCRSCASPFPERERGVTLSREALPSGLPSDRSAGAMAK